MDVFARIPELQPLRAATIVVIGAGGLGGPSVLEFARSGVAELRVVDPETVDPGNTVRWPLGLRAAGWNKGNALAAYVRENWPHTSVRHWTSRIGAPRLRLGEDGSDLELLDELFDGASLVYDATAEMGVAHALSDVARQAEVPYVVLWTTPGAWGGLAARIRADKDAACWMCFRHHLDTGGIESPPGDPTGTIQPLGCADPTFTGAGFDVASVASFGVRLAVATLCGAKPASYPAASWDVATLAFRAAADDLKPSIETTSLERWAGCPATYNH